MSFRQAVRVPRICRTSVVSSTVCTRSCDSTSRRKRRPTPGSATRCPRRRRRSRDAMSDVLPSDLHTHTEWSPDAPDGSMEGSCRRAVEIGLPAIAFTDHAELAPSEPQLAIDGYLQEVQRCRSLFPSLRVRSGIELGQPHRYPAAADALLRSAEVDLVVGSVHRVPVGEEIVELSADVVG